MSTDSLTLTLEPGERWWGGAVADGQAMPFGTSAVRRDLAVNAGLLDDPSAGANQSAPLLVSNRGRYVWSESPYRFAFDGHGGLEVQGVDLVLGQAGTTVGDAFRAATAHFPPSGSTPAAAMFAAPQYNTWIEMPYAPTQEKVLDYVRGLLDAGFPPGAVMIDDRWSVDYGSWRFDPAAFPDPVAMTRQLHDWGCAVMVWLVPFVSPDSATSRELAARGFLITAPDGEPVVRKWWNGYSTLLDLTHPGAVEWLHAQLRSLIEVDGVDGFKFDAGDLRDYRLDDVTVGGGGPTRQTLAYAELGSRYPANEFRACWKAGGQPLAQRLHDKPPVWGRGGLASLIPEGIAQGLIGHPYVCPDMIGGGELDAIGDSIDQELFVRYAQVAALFPMMQFSTAPWRVLDAEHLAAVHAAVRLHQELVPLIWDLATRASRSGEPILRPLAYGYDGFEQVQDQFLLGDDLLCAPVLERGATSRRVLLPPGRWEDPDGAVAEGPAEVSVPVGLATIPRWRRR